MLKASMKPYFVAIVVQLIYTGMFVISKAAFNHGMNIYIFIFYRQAVGSLILLPTALLQRKSERPVMTLGVLIKLFFCALIGVTLGVNLYHVSLKFTSATVASAVDSSLPAITFFLAVLLSVALCLAGVFTIAFFAGPSISPINHHRAFASDAGSKTVVPRGAAVQKEYPDKMVVTVTQCLFSTVQSFVVAVVAEHDFSRWKLRFDISLLAVLYSGVMVTGVSYYLQTWCLEMRGPMFFASWTPLCFVFTIFCSSFFLGEIVHLGSILGGILLVGSLHTMLWGKSKEGNGTNDVTDDDIEKSTQIYPGEQQHTTTDHDKESTLTGSAALHVQEL
uniref:WAT1-related protein n=1 Tax=Oryza punctata TaxID=4537 RepID=A0A0E0KFN5_ORYPU